MEYIEGFDIDDAFNFSSIGLEDENLPDKMFEQAISAFCYLENKKILHRDIRASNLLVDKSSNLKLIDFGFGKMLEPSKDIAESIILNWPATQMPEEIISSESSFYDKTTEIYFLGALFKQLLNSYDTVSFSYNSIINRMAKIRRKERYQNFTEIQNELSGKIFKNAFSSQEKDVYREFAQYLSDILIELNSEYVINYEVADVIRLCNELYEDNILEANIQNNNLLVRCFITEGAFMYDRSVHVPMEVYINFLKLLNDAPEFKQRLIINNIANRIRKTRIKTIEDDLPF
jgi:serine/threonine-protein kinase